MSAYEVQYADAFGNHAIDVDAWDDQDAVHQFRLQHAGEDTVLIDVIRIGSVEEVEVAA